MTVFRQGATFCLLEAESVAGVVQRGPTRS